MVDDSGREKRSMLGRVVLWAAAASAILAGVKYIASGGLPGDAKPGLGAGPVPAVTAAGYPQDSARAVAVRAAAAYLTWDEAHPEDRERELKAVLAAGLDGRLGWDGRGAQVVTAAVPGAVEAGAGGRARVRVEVRVTSGAGPAWWVGLDVPVAVVAGGRLVVVQAPALVGIPAGAGPAPKPLQTVDDQPFSSSTRSVVDSFFSAWAAGTAGQVAAPGVEVPALPAGVVALGEVASWSAVAGAGADRRGVAEVVWRMGGGEVSQEYAVELTRVESARGAGRWQVAKVSGGGV
ncbi:hypothetical protein ACFXJO_40425 [Streptomyces lavendulae]|uniref:hypothetical protein n=1 Tax=Streptomyces lavendulae TaxID=1914 RepID=UPI0036A0167E